MSQPAKRNRRRFVLWTVGTAIAVVLVGSLALRLYGRHRLAEARARFEERIGPLDASATHDRPDGDPAAIVARIDAAPKLEDAQRSIVGTLARKARRDWTPVETDAARQAVEENRESLAELDRSAIPATWGDVVEAKLAVLMDVARLVAVQGRLDPHDETAVRSVEVLGRLAESLQAEPDVRCFMLGLFVERLQLSVVRDIVATRGPGHDELRRLRLAVRDNDLPGLWRQAYALDLAVGASSHVEEYRSMKTAPLWERYWYASVSDLMLADCLDMAVDVGDALSSPYAEVPSRIEALGGRWSPWSGRMGNGIPNFINVSGRAAVIASLRNQARLALDLQDHARSHDAYPSSMETLPQAMEPSPLTGRGCEYLRTPDGGARLSAPGASEVVERDQLLPGGDEDDFIWDLARLPSSFSRN